VTKEALEGITVSFSVEIPPATQSASTGTGSSQGSSTEESSKEREHEGDQSGEDAGSGDESESETVKEDETKNETKVQGDKKEQKDGSSEGETNLEGDGDKFDEEAGAASKQQPQQQPKTPVTLLCLGSADFDSVADNGLQAQLIVDETRRNFTLRLRTSDGTVAESKFACSVLCLDEEGEEGGHVDPLSFAGREAVVIEPHPGHLLYYTDNARGRCGFCHVKVYAARSCRDCTFLVCEHCWPKQKPVPALTTTHLHPMVFDPEVSACRQCRNTCDHGGYRCARSCSHQLCKTCFNKVKRKLGVPPVSARPVESHWHTFTLTVDTQGVVSVFIDGAKAHTTTVSLPSLQIVKDKISVQGVEAAIRDVALWTFPLDPKSVHGLATRGLRYLIEYDQDALREPIEIIGTLDDIARLVTVGRIVQVYERETPDKSSPVVKREAHMYWDFERGECYLTLSLFPSHCTPCRFSRRACSFQELFVLRSPMALVPSRSYSPRCHRCLFRLLSQASSRL